MERDDNIIQLGTAPDETVDGEWHRLAPLSILSEIINFLTRSLIGLVAFGFFIMRNDDFGDVKMLLPFAVLLLAVGPVLGWYRFRYSVDSREIRIAQGIFSRSLRIIPMERVVDVAIERKPVHRMLGLAKVTIETGGGGKAEEGTLDALSHADADQLRDMIRAAQQVSRGQNAAAGAAGDDNDTIGVEEETPLFTMSARDLLSAGLFNFSLTFIAVVGAAVNQFDFLIPFDVYNADFWFDVLGRGQILLDLGWLTQAIAVAAGLVSLLILGAITGIVRTVLRDYGFTLTRTPRGLRRRRGLFTQSDVVMPVHRIQSAIVSTGPMRRWFGYYGLSVESLASDADKQENHSLAPHARLDAVGRLLDEIDLVLEPGTPRYGRMVPVLIGGVIWGAIFLGLAVGMTLSDLSQADFVRAEPWLKRAVPIAEIALFALALWSVASGWLSWRMHHFWIADGHIFVRHGLWNQRLIILPLVKLQSIDWAQGPLTQSMGVAKIRFGVAGGSALAVHELPWLPMAEVAALRADLIAPAAAVDYSVLVRREKRAA